MSEQIQGIQSKECSFLTSFYAQNLLMQKKASCIEKVEGNPSNPEYLESYTLIRSRLLGGELIVYVYDQRHLHEAHAAHPGAVLYLPPEIHELARYASDERMVRAVHAVKKVFGAWDREVFGAWIVPQPGGDRP